MIEKKLLPKTNLLKLKSEILMRGAEAALPENLSDNWLRIIGRDILSARRAEIEGRQDDVVTNIAAPLLLVMALLTRKLGLKHTEYNLSEGELMVSLGIYEVAITEEILARETGIYLSKWTLENVV